MRRMGVLGAVFLVALVCAPSVRASSVRADFNGDTFDDIAIGVQNETIDDVIFAGAVSVIYGSASGLSPTVALPDQFWHRNSPGVPGKAKQSAFFGSALAVGDFDDDSFDDLAIGAPGDTVGGQQVAGSITILYGSTSGLTAGRAKTFHQDSKAVKDRAEESDAFGAALAAGDLNGDGIDDLAVGAPTETVVRRFQGAVNILFGTSRGLSASGPGQRLLHQDVGGVEEEGSSDDRFGSAVVIADLNGDGIEDLAVGASGEGLGEASAIGVVHVLYSTAQGIDPISQPNNDELIHQGDNGYEGDLDGGDRFGRTLASGDFNGDDIADLAIGTKDDVGTAFNAGALAVVYGGAPFGVAADNGPGDQLIHQDSTGIPDAAAINDDFTASLAVGDFNNDGVDDIAVGNPGDIIGTQSDAGTTTVIYGDDPDGLLASNTPGVILLHEDGANVDDVAEQVDYFGKSVASGDYDGDGSDDIVVGVPGEDRPGAASAGAAHAFSGDPTLGISAANTPADLVIAQDSPDVEDDPEQSDVFGQAVAAATR